MAFYYHARNTPPPSEPHTVSNSESLRSLISAFSRLHLGLPHRWSLVLFLARRGGDFLFTKNDQTVWGAHPDSCSVGIGCGVAGAWS
jgi:hypothetical protein